MNVNRLYVVGAVLREDDGGIWTDPAQTRKATHAALFDLGYVPAEDAGEHAEEYHQAVSRRIQQLGAEGRRALAERDHYRAALEDIEAGATEYTSHLTEIAHQALHGPRPTPESQEESPHG